MLTSYAVKTGRQPMVINLDPREGMLSIPGSFSAAAYSSIIDIEEGWGSSPISGPSPIPVKQPLVYQYGLKDPEEGKVFKPLVTRMALAVTSRLEEDTASKQAGFIIDSCGSISQGKNGVYDNIEHIVSEFSVNVLVTLGSERLYSDLSRKFATRSPDPTDIVSVLRLDKSGGCVDRSEPYMRALRHSQIRSYFFGAGEALPLAPSSQMADFADLNIFRVREAGEAGFVSSGGDAADYGFGFGYGGGGADAEEVFEKVGPTAAELQDSLLAVTMAGAGDKHGVIRDACVRGYVYVADVDEGKKKVKLLSPMPGTVGGNALVLGRWPEDVPGLVN